MTPTLTQRKERFFGICWPGSWVGRPPAGISALQFPLSEKNGRMREIIKLESTAGTGYFYTITKNKKKNTEKLEINKYDPRARKHVKFVEKKLSK